MPAPDADAGLRIVVGLGNPGREYEDTPHNLGFQVVERLAGEAGARISRPEARSLTAHITLEGAKVILAKPLTYMNLSGEAVRDLLKKFAAGPDALVVVSDELNLPFGALRIRERGSAGGHHGLESIIDLLGLQEFVRVRLGVAPDHPVGDAADFLLRPFPRARREQVDELVARAADAVRVLLRAGPAAAMNQFNRRPDNDIPDSSPQGEDPS
jgi:PTH1 family peptidyl-tRNA hydrolase